MVCGTVVEAFAYDFSTALDGLEPRSGERRVEWRRGSFVCGSVCGLVVQW